MGERRSLFYGFWAERDGEEGARFQECAFIVVLDEEGKIVQMGSKKKIDFGDVPGIVKESLRGVEEPIGERAFVMDMDF